MGWGKSDFIKNWITPGGTVEDVGACHSRWLLEHPDVAKKYKVNLKTSGKSWEAADQEVRLHALNAGFVRLNYMHNTGTQIIECNRKYWSGQKDNVWTYINENKERIDNIDIHLLDDRGTLLSRYPSTLFRYSDDEKMEHIYGLTEKTYRPVQIGTTDEINEATKTVMDSLCPAVSAVREPLSESGYSRLMQILHGDVPKINSIGIVTAENPQGETLSAAENNRRNERLREMIGSAGYAYRQIKGHFEVIENPFVVFNASREQTVEWGMDWSQKAVIWCHRVSLPKREGFVCEWIEGDKTIRTRSMFLAHVGDEEKYYSEIKGRKFRIPFFEDPYEGAEWDRGRITFKESELPLDDRLIDGGGNETTIRELVSEIKRREIELLDETKNGKHHWQNRGMLWVYLQQIQKHLRKKGGFDLS